MDEQAKKTLLILSLSLVGIVVALSALAFGLPYIQKRAPLPTGFSESRSRAAEISRDIVSLSNETNDKVKALSALDPKKDKAQATALVADAKAKNNEAYAKAVDLSKELEGMSNSFKGIKSLDLQRIMYDGIAVEIALVTEFIQYTKDFNGFLEAVSAFLANPTPEHKLAVQAGESAVNTRVTNINRLNDEFLKRMDEFEKALK
jgi:hypothetical protein